jgi:hypothetical protein
MIGLKVFGQKCKSRSFTSLTPRPVGPQTRSVQDDKSKESDRSQGPKRPALGMTLQEDYTLQGITRSARLSNRAIR